MEFKLRLTKKQKAQKTKNREIAGFKRIKIRGRKRWVKAAVQKSDTEKE
ncbi:MAG: hypothetical protein LBJ46_03315 [Planctomycetota bacterium]|jgi:hypothetical protein|nr:hypothetical protein [Planctomycetota bacterium]